MPYVAFLFFLLNSVALAETCNNKQNYDDSTLVAKDYGTAKDVCDEWIPCKASRKSISIDELKTIQKQFWSNELFRNAAPDGNCFIRAELLAYELDQAGIQSKQLLLTGPMLATFKIGNNYQSVYFDVHAAVVISVVQLDGSTEDMILDPEFTDEPMNLDVYLENLTPKVAKVPEVPKEIDATNAIRKIKTNGIPPDFDSTICKDLIDELDEQSFQSGKRDFIVHACLKPESKVDSCSFSKGTLDFARSEILESIKNPKEDFEKRMGFPTRERSQNSYTALYGFPIDPKLVTTELKHDVSSALDKEPKSKRSFLKKRWQSYLDEINKQNR